MLRAPDSWGELFFNMLGISFHRSMIHPPINTIHECNDFIYQVDQ